MILGAEKEDGSGYHLILVVPIHTFGHKAPTTQMVGGTQSWEVRTPMTTRGKGGMRLPRQIWEVTGTGKIPTPGGSGRQESGTVLGTILTGEQRGEVHRLTGLDGLVVGHPVGGSGTIEIGRVGGTTGGGRRHGTGGVEQIGGITTGSLVGGRVRRADGDGT